MPATKKLALSKKEIENDPLNVTARMYQQVDKLIGQLEALDVLEDGVTVPQRIAALIATGRIMKMMQDLRKGSLDVGAGSAIDKYTAAFQTPHAASGREPKPRPTNLVQFDRTDADTNPYADEDDA